MLVLRRLFADLHLDDPLLRPALAAIVRRQPAGQTGDAGAPAAVLAGPKPAGNAHRGPRTAPGRDKAARTVVSHPKAKKRYVQMFGQ